jgi:hypothetical protein
MTESLTQESLEKKLKLYGFGDASDSAKNFSTNFSTLQGYHRLCTPAAPGGIECNAAVHRFCADHGYSGGGLGPVESSADSVQLTCLTGDAASLVSTNFAALKKYHPDCDVSHMKSGACNSAVSRLCETEGYGGGGFGPVEYIADSVFVTCVKSGHGSKLRAPLSAMQGYRPDCRFSTAASAACSTASFRHCAARGYLSGFGLLEYYDDTVELSCLKL